MSKTKLKIQLFENRLKIETSEVERQRIKKEIEKLKDEVLMMDPLGTDRQKYFGNLFRSAFKR